MRVQVPPSGLRRRSSTGLEQEISNLPVARSSRAVVFLACGVTVARVVLSHRVWVRILVGQLISRGDGIGRHAGFRLRCCIRMQHTGSTPVLGTIYALVAKLD